MQINSFIPGIKIPSRDENQVDDYAFWWGYTLVSISLHPKAIFVMTRLLKKVMNKELRLLENQMSNFNDF